MDQPAVRIGLAVLAVAVVGGLAWYILDSGERAPQSPVADSPHSESPPDEESPAPRIQEGTTPPTPDADPPETQPAEPGQIERLFAALEKAAELGDIEGANEARKRLAAIGDDEVHERAAALLQRTRESNMTGRQRAILIGNTIYLVALKDADLALAWLRERWSEPRLSEEGRLEKWEAYNLRSADALAARILTRDDQGETSPIGRILSWIGEDDGNPPQVIATTLKNHYSGEFSDDELPDPWLSEAFRSMMAIGVDVHAASAAPVRDMLIALRDNEALSRRLRAQLDAYLQSDPGSIYELVDAISEASSTRMAADAMRAYLQSQVLTESDVDLLLAAIHQKYGSVPNGPATLLNYIVADGARGISLENLQTLVGTLLKMLPNEDRQPSVNMTILEIIEGLRVSWTNVSDRAGSPTPMLSGESLGDTRQALRRSFHGIKVSGGQSSQRLARTRVMALLWNSPLPLADKLGDTLQILRAHDDFDWTLSSAVIGGLGRHRGNFRPALSQQVVAMLDFLFEHFDDPLRAGERPYDSSSRTVSLTAKIAQTLKECEYPQLPERLRRQLMNAAESVIKDSEGWQTIEEAVAEGVRHFFDYRGYLDSIMEMRDAYTD